jgi:hypothetical protein
MDLALSRARLCAMDWQTHPVTPDRFEDFADIINLNRRDREPATEAGDAPHSLNADRGGTLSRLAPTCQSVSPGQTGQCTRGFQSLNVPSGLARQIHAWSS